MFLRNKISQRCRQKEEPYCPDKSDVTAETCAWACLHFTSTVEGSASRAWPCPGQAKCIARHQICDGIPDCDKGQDEDINLCTEDFCKNGFVSYDRNHINYTSSHDELHHYKYLTDVTEMGHDYIFLDYRYPNFPSNHMNEYRNKYAMAGGKVITSSLQNLEMPKCKNSTKCLRRNSYDEDSKVWIDC